MARHYEEQNPWIDFQYSLEFSPLWARLGEAYSKCEHLANTPLKPSEQQRLAAVYMNKGAVASAAIEGNTLTVDDFEALNNGIRKLPQSQQYLKVEIDNVLEVLNNIQVNYARGKSFNLTTQWIKSQNKKILANLDTPDYAIPGEFCTSQMVVGTYRGAPPEDIEFLYDRMCEWLNRDYIHPANQLSDDKKDQRFYLYLIASILAHLYIVWIHGFGDGNGRTARIVQTAILMQSGVVPWTAANILSDYYNQTRSLYYAKLSESSTRRNVNGFIEYSVQGFVEKIREQIFEIQESQKNLAWESYVNEILSSEHAGEARDRRRDVALAILDTPEGLTRDEIAELTPAIARSYGREERKLSRDLGKLDELGLIYRVSRGRWASNKHIMDSFMPGKIQDNS
ncbi:Fic family protein [Alloscardovia venturai]|uniref:Fic family protein n=1 Tax=Alloscardovia venturai TaxID=1769421 RepID=A0ABW2Y507_9BIFI